MGDGESIKIWEHNWLLDLLNSRVVSPQTNTDIFYVKDSFMAGRRVWDRGLVDEVSLPWEAELIKRIPMSEGCVEDLLI